MGGFSFLASHPDTKKSIPVSLGLILDQKLISSAASKVARPAKISTGTSKIILAKVAGGKNRRLGEVSRKCGDRNCFSDQAFNSAYFVSLFGCYKRNRMPPASGSAGPANAMYIIFRS